MGDQIYTLVFDGRAGDINDIRAQGLIHRHGAEVLGCGTFLASDPPQRDIEFSVPAGKAQGLIEALRASGFKPSARVH